MASNLDELKSISRLALIKEMIEKTKSCAIIWNEIKPGYFRSCTDSYDLHLSQTSASIYSLDVIRGGKLFRSYNSSTQSEVDVLFQTVLSLSTMSSLEKIKTMGKFLKQIGNPSSVYNFIPQSVGVDAGGNAVNSHIREIETQLLPTSLTFGPTPSELYIWLGNHLNIDDSPNAESHDGDISYIRQQVSGTGPTNWGYAFCGFNINEIISEPPYSFNVRVAHRRSTNDGVILNVDVLANSSVIYSATDVSDISYTVFSSGLQQMIGIDSIEDLQVRLSMFTNVGNPLLRSLLITAVDLRIYGIVEES